VTDRDGPAPLIVIPELPVKNPKRTRSISVSLDTYKKLRAIKDRTRQPYAVILALLVERAK